MVPLVVAMCVLYKYLSTMLFHRQFFCYFVNFLVEPEHNSTCKHLIKFFEQILKRNGSLHIDFSGI